MSAKTKTFTPKQLARLPDPGYLVELVSGVGALGGISTVYCVKNGQVKYVRAKHEWATLLWSCCPTRKTIAKNAHGIEYDYFADHESMIAKHPDIFGSAHTKAPNDF